MLLEGLCESLVMLIACGVLNPLLTVQLVPAYKDMASFCLQVDHDDHDNAALTAFNQLWESKFAKDSLLVFSTGRSHALYTDLRVMQIHSPLLFCKWWVPPAEARHSATHLCCASRQLRIIVIRQQS